MSAKPVFQVTTGILLSLWLAACSPTAVRGVPVTDLPASALSSHPRLAEQFFIAPGDELAVKFFYNPELNEELVVRPDGRISLQLVPEVLAAGQTPAQLSEVLRQAYSTEFKQVRVAVIVKSIAERQAFVDGEVGQPGILSFTNPISVLQAIAFSQGATDRALLDQVLIVRRAADQQPLVIQANIKQVLDGTDLGQDIFLLPNDIVYLPRKPISDVNIWVDQYIRQMLPVPFSIQTR